MPNEKDLISPEEKSALLQRWYNDPVDFMQTCLPRWFFAPFSWVHRGFIAILTHRTAFLSKYGDLEKIQEEFVYRKKDPWDKAEPPIHLFEWADETHKALKLTTTRYNEIMMPRGIGKTTLVEGCLVWFGCFLERKFPLLLGETATHAENIQRNVRTEFEVNETLKFFFGDLCGRGLPSKQWNDQQFELANGFVMACTGRGGQVRGRNVKGQRPDLILLDDVEDIESVSTPEQLMKTRRWFSGDVLPAMSEITQDGQIILAGTLLNSDALLVTLGRDPIFTTVVFGALDSKGEPLFESYMTKEKLEAKKDYYERQGLLDQFYLEYFNEMNNEATRVLSSKLVQYGSAGNNVIAYALAVDPAISKKKSADQTAFALVSLHPGARYTIQRIDGYRGMTPQDTLATFFSLRKNLIATLPKDEDGSPTVPFACGVESVAYQEALNDLIVAEMAKSGDWFQLEKIKYTNEKKARILATLEPRYRNNLIFHSHKFLDYESQMDNFPRGHDDLLDAVCMAIDLLEPFLRESASIGLDSEDGMIYTDYDELVETGGI